MELKTVLLLGSRRYLASTVVVLLLNAGGMAYIWSQYKDLQNEKERFSSTQKTYFEERNAFEKYRAAANIELTERKAEIEKREFVVGQLEMTNTQRQVDVAKKTNELAHTELALSDLQRTKDAEEKLQKLMSEFSALGVDLNNAVPCDNQEAQRRFDAAKAKYYEAYSLAEAYRLTKRFEMFFFHNGQSHFPSCEKKAAGPT